MNNKEHKMKCRYCCSHPSGREVLEYLVYVALVLTSTFFIAEMVKEYLAENTNFSITEEPITKEDLPTITICILIRTEKKEKEEEPRTIKYGQDFTVQTMDSNSDWFNPNATMISLSEGNNGHNFFEQKRQIKLEEMRVFKTGYLLRYCVKLQFTISELSYRKSMVLQGDLYDLGMFSITLSENITENVQEVTLYTTSENNSYGTVLAQWYGGKVNPIQLQRGEYTQISTTKMRRYEYLEKKCNPISFYGCLGEKIWQQKTC